MRRLLLTAIAILLGYNVALASSVLYVGKTLVTYYDRVAAPYCGSPVAAPTWTDRSHVRQQFQHCQLRARLRILTPIALTSTPLPRSTLLPSPTVIPTAVPPTPWPTMIPSATPVPSNDPVQQLLVLINDHRASYGSSPLQLISDATTARHAAYMAGDGTIWHTSSLHPDASFPYDSFDGENIGAGQYVQQIDAGMWAEGVSTCSLGTVSHACNIVNPGFHYIAISLASGLLSGYPAVYLVEDFRA